MRGPVVVCGPTRDARGCTRRDHRCETEQDDGAPVVYDYK